MSDLRRALLVGLDEYDNFPRLGGCANDVAALGLLLQRHEDKTPNFDLWSVDGNDGRVDRRSLLARLIQLFEPGADIALLYFAGHGFKHGNDLYLATQDGSALEPGVLVSQIMDLVHSSSVKEVIIILDCCFSGAGGGSVFLSLGAASLRPGVVILSATRAAELAVETENGRGLFSEFLCGGLEGGAADTLGKVTLAGMYGYLSEAFRARGQRPSFKGNLDRLHVIRRCNPAVAIENLRRLSEFFLTAHAEHRLSPAYEPEHPTHDPEKVKIFSILQRFRAARLVEPVDEEHMFFAAIKSGSCRLTPLGRLYWRMSSEGRI